jgi:DNA-directed RNA polymerase specialized sigma24 family protein
VASCWQCRDGVASRREAQERRCKKRNQNSSLEPRSLGASEPQGEQRAGQCLDGRIPWIRLRQDVERFVIRLGVRETDPSDIAGDVMMKAFVRFRGDDEVPPHRVWCWMRRVARNRCADLWRAAKRNRIETRSEFDDVVVAFPVEEVPTTSAALLAELRRVAVGTSRVVLDLLQEGVTSNAEIANRLGNSVRAVERARQRLRALLHALQVAEVIVRSPTSLVQGGNIAAHPNLRRRR